MDDAVRIERVAECLLAHQAAHQAAGSAAPSGAVAVEALAQALGVQVASFAGDDLPPDTLGYLEPGEDLIFVRAGLPAPIRRFTIAHELGHVVLHRASGDAANVAGTWTSRPSPDADVECAEADLLDTLDVSGADAEVLGGTQVYSAHTRRESEANAFAAALLVPLDRLRERYLASRGRRGGALTRSLAAEFGVTEAVLLRRLTTLLQPPVLEEAPTQVEGARTAPARLDEEQAAAAETEAPALVVAGPGTGKTSTLVARLRYLLVARGLAPERIVALTFSRKAAREMAERAAALTGEVDAAERGPLAPARRPVISTIHSFCGELLRHYAPHVGLRPDFRLLTEAEGYFLLRRAVARVSLDELLPLTAPELYFPDMLRAISRAKDELLDPQAYQDLVATVTERAVTPDERDQARRAREFARVYAGYQEELAARGDADYGDLIRLAVRLLSEHPDVLEEMRGRYDAILVDEFQDINRAMGVFLHTLAGADGPLWVVGDPDQSIYRFRGASPANLDRFTAEYSGAVIRRLTHNYRSYAPIVRAAHAHATAFLEGDGRAPLVAERGDPRRRGVTLATAPTEQAELGGLVSALRARHDAGHAWADLAVLCRTRRQVRRVIETLRAADIPTREIAPLLEQPDVRDMLALVSLCAGNDLSGLLRAREMRAHRFSREEARAAITAVRERKLPLADALRLRADVLGGSAASRQAMRRLGSALDSMRTAPDVSSGLARYIFALTGTGRQLVRGVAHGDDEQTVRASHMARLIALARAFDDARRDADLEPRTERPQRKWAEFVDYLRVLLSMPAPNEAAVGQGDGEDPGVAVMTVHASKGLEFPVVFLPGLAAGRFPSQRHGGRIPAVERLLDPMDTGRDAAHLTEEACLFYVAVTRARDELILSRAERYGQRNAYISPFLTPIEDALGPELCRVTWDTPVDVTVARQEAERWSPSDEGALTVVALETYARCPRQFAYRYLEHLDAQSQHLSRMQRAVVATTRWLYEPREPAANGAHNGVHLRQLTLDDALDVFETAFTGDTSVESSEAPHPHTEVYRRHGQRMVEQAWHELRERAAHGAPTVRFDESMTVAIGDQPVQLTIDRLEEGSAPGVGRSVTRLIRERLTTGSDRPDVRAMLYTLAAEQSGERPTEVYQRDMSTGERVPIRLSTRQRASLRAEADAALEGIARGDFTPRPSAHYCQMCPFLMICPQ